MISVGSGSVSPHAINIQDYFITVLLSHKTKPKMFRYVEGALKSAKEMNAKKK